MPCESAPRNGAPSSRVRSLEALGERLANHLFDRRVFDRQVGDRERGQQSRARRRSVFPPDLEHRIGEMKALHLSERGQASFVTPSPPPRTSSIRLTRAIRDTRTSSAPSYSSRPWLIIRTREASAVTSCM